MSKTRTEIVKELREYHQLVFNALGVPDAAYVPKLAWKPQDKDYYCMGFFANELSSGVDVYTEYVSSNLEPEDPERKLWRWKYNPHFAEEYDTIPTSSGHVRYLIPVEELHLVTVDSQVKPESKELPKLKTKSLSFEIMDPDNDAPIDQMTIKDLAAILWQAPVSDKSFLNKLITERWPKHA